MSLTIHHMAFLSFSASLPAKVPDVIVLVKCSETHSSPPWSRNRCVSEWFITTHLRALSITGHRFSRFPVKMSRWRWLGGRHIRAFKIALPKGVRCAALAFHWHAEDFFGSLSSYPSLKEKFTLK